MRAESSGGASGLSKQRRMKRITIHLPGTLLSDMDAVARHERRSRGDIVRRAVAAWLRERSGPHTMESLQRGYLEMAGINLMIASEAFHAEDDADHTLGRMVARD